MPRPVQYRAQKAAENAAVEDDSSLPYPENVRVMLDRFRVRDEVQGPGTDESAGHQPDGELVNRLGVEPLPPRPPCRREQRGTAGEQHCQAETRDPEAESGDLEE